MQIERKRRETQLVEGGGGGGGSAAGRALLRTRESGIAAGSGGRQCTGDKARGAARRCASREQAAALAGLCQLTAAEGGRSRKSLSVLFRQLS